MEDRLLLVRLKTHVSAPRRVLDFVQGAAFGLNVAEVQFNAGNHDLGTTTEKILLLQSDSETLRASESGQVEGNGFKNAAPPTNNPVKVSQF